MEQTKISISESDFDFQIFVSPCITQCRIGLYNIMLMIMLICYILCLALCIYDTFNTLHTISHNHFTFFLINIVTLYTFFQRVCVTFYTFFQAVLCKTMHKGTIRFSIFDALNHILLHQHFALYHILLHLYFMYFQYNIFNITL